VTYGRSACNRYSSEWAFGRHNMNQVGSMPKHGEPQKEENVMRLSVLTKSAWFGLILVVSGSLSAALGQYAYIASQAGGVSVVNESTGQVVSTLPVSGNPIGVAMTPAGNRLYVSQSNANTVTVIDTASNGVVATIPVGKEPLGIAAAPSGQMVYVANAVSGTVSAISTVTNTVVASIKVQTGPVSLVVSPNNSTAFVVNLYSRSISVVNTLSNKVKATWPLGYGSSAVAISPNGKTLYVAGRTTNQLYLYDTSSGHVLGKIGGLSFPDAIAVSPKGNFIYVSNGTANSVSVISMASHQVVATIPVGTSPAAVAVSPNGSQLYVANMGTNSLSIVNTATNLVVATVSNLMGAPVAVAGTNYVPTNPFAPAPTGLKALPSSIVLPALPQTVPNPVYPTVTGPTLTVNSADELQNVLNSVQCGGAVEIQPGVYTGNYTYSQVCPDGTPVLIYGSNVSSFPAGLTMPPTPLSNLPVLTTTNNTAPFVIANGASNVYIAAIAFTVANPIPNGVYPIVNMGDSDATTVAQLPSNITFDRVQIYAPDPPGPNGPFVQRGISLNCVNCSIINSAIWNITNNCMDTQAISIDNTPGPVLIYNDYVEATGEDIMLNTKECQSGYCGSGIPNVIPSDVTVGRMHFHKQLAWMNEPAGCVPGGEPQCYNVKNDFEIKHGQRVFVYDSIFDTTFAQAQEQSIIINCWASGPYVCNDVTFQNLLVEHSPQVFAFSGNGSSSTAQRVLARNILGVDINGGAYAAPGTTGRGYFFEAQNTGNVTLDHNTVINEPPLYMNGSFFGDAPPSTNPSFTYTNNIQYGPLMSNGSSPGGTVAALPSSAVISTDVLVGDYWPNKYPGGPLSSPLYPPSDDLATPASTSTPVAGQPPCNYANKPIAQCWPLDWSQVGFADFTGGNAGTDLAGVTLLSSSPYHNAATDGMDIGVNVSAVLAAISGIQ